MAKNAKKIYDDVTDAVMNSGLEDVVIFNDVSYPAIVTDEVELRNYYGMELDTNKLALIVKKDLFSALSRGSVVTFKEKQYAVKSKVQDFYGTYVVGLIEHED